MFNHLSTSLRLIRCCTHRHARSLASRRPPQVPSAEQSRKNRSPGVTSFQNSSPSQSLSSFRCARIRPKASAKSISSGHRVAKEVIDWCNLWESSRLSNEWSEKGGLKFGASFISVGQSIVELDF